MAIKHIGVSIGHGAGPTEVAPGGVSGAGGYLRRRKNWLRDHLLLWLGL